jgi:hypothetical protein
MDRKISSKYDLVIDAFGKAIAETVLDKGHEGGGATHFL